MPTLTDNVDLWVPPIPIGPSKITFVWHFRDASGDEHIQTMEVELGAGEPLDIITHVREHHGVFLPVEGVSDGTSYFFLPWPPSSIRVDAI